MGGVKSVFDMAHWESLPDIRRLEFVKNWILIEVDGKRVKGIVIKKETADKMSEADRQSLNKRGISIFIQDPAKPVPPENLYETPKGEVKVIKADDSLNLPSRSIRKEDYDKLTPEQRAKTFTGALYYFKDTDTLIPESQALVDAKLAEIKRIEEMEARRTYTISLNSWVLTLYK